MMSRIAAALVLVLLGGGAVDRATAACLPGGTSTPNGRNALLSKPPHGHCFADVLDANVDEVGNHGAFLTLPGTFTAPQTFNAGKFIDKGNLVYDVRAYGADGGADDTAAIQAALTACAATKATVRLLPGTSTISSTLTATDCIVEGAGRGASTLTATSALAGSPMLILTNSVSNGAIRTASLRDLTIQCSASAPPAFPGGAGLHPTNRIDGVRIDQAMEVRDLQIDNCDKGAIVNSPTGYVSIHGVDIHDNFYGIYYLVDAGGNSIWDSQIAGNRFASIGIPTTQSFDFLHMARVQMGFGPYCIYQEGITNNPFLIMSLFDSVHCEGMGNAMFFTNNYSNGGGNAGLFSGNSIVDPGISSDSATYRLNPSGVCSGVQTGPSGLPLDCCTGVNTGCDHDYEMRIGQTNLSNYIRTAPQQGGFSTPSGGVAAIYIHNLLQGFFVETSSSSQPTFTINAGKPGWVHVQGFNGQEYSAGIDSLASAATVSLDNEPRLVNITGTTGITALSTTATKVGQIVTLHFAGAVTLTNSASLKLIGAANFTTSADDTMTFYFDGTNWIEISRGDK